MGWDDLAGASDTVTAQSPHSHQSQVYRPARNIAKALDPLIKISTPLSLDTIFFLTSNFVISQKPKETLGGRDFISV
jgi:hypothetical protein